MRKMIIICLAILSTSSYAGLYDLTHHSRANCANNETISWHAGHSYWFWIVSRHRHNNGTDHQLVQDWALAWRAAAVHWGEGTGGWSVEGHHWMRDGRGKPVEVANEFVRDCSIYDGWWDK